MKTRANRKAAYYQSDRQLAIAASDAIKWLTTIPQETIRVTAHCGHLHLDGHVDSLRQRSVIEEVARSLPGVQRVTNLIWVEADPVFNDVRSVVT